MMTAILAKLTSKLWSPYNGKNST